MPIFEFQCSVCRARFEKIQKKPGRARCSCGGKAKRVVSVPAFHLKGDGWGGFSTDNSLKDRTRKRKEKFDRCDDEDIADMQEFLG